ncbi:MAG TPA: hypothetical protein VG225_03820 [Terracidiphilus sp.]|jgi:hypothetical protein|nr:hypothetical protein [Terracidiphilus sp.]
MKSFFTLFVAVSLGALSAGAQSPPAPADPPADAATAPAAPAPAAVPAPADTSYAPAIAVPSTIPGTLVRAGAEAAAMTDPVQTLLNFKDSNVKFGVDRLMDILRDKRHEGWVLAAYPDPKTSQPLIGAGFSLDLPQRVHLQRDPLNPHPFLEPSSSQLWQAAGLAPEKLKNILDQFDARMAEWGSRSFRSQLRDLDPQITDDDANALLRVGIVQAIENARAYCRNFDGLSASQQMGMTQLVYQMGINLEEFSSFLTLLNRDNGSGPEARAIAKADAEYWRSVQLSLVQSQWARLYRDRAKAVIAMLDPRYEANPARAERSVGTVLRPVRHRRGRASLRAASYTRHRGSAGRRRAAHTRKD